MRKKNLRSVCLSFCLSAIFACGLVVYSEQQKLTAYQLQVHSLLNEHAEAFKDELSQNLSSTYALAALILKNAGHLQDFASIAQEIHFYYPKVATLVFAPEGVLNMSFPTLPDLMGINLLQDSRYAAVAQAALTTEKLQITPPFVIGNGEQAVLALLPLYISNTAAQKQFWGFAGALLRLPQALEAARFPMLQRAGFEYRAETGQNQLIMLSNSMAVQMEVSTVVQVANSTWKFSAAPSNGWFNLQWIAAKLFAALLFSVIVTYQVRLALSRRRYQHDLEAEVKSRTAEILAAKNKLEAILNVIPDFLFELNTAGFCFSAYAPDTHPLALYTEALTGKHLFSGMPAEIATEVLLAFDEAKQQGYSAGHQITFCLQGTEYSFELAVTFQQSTGAEPHFIVLARDVTHRVRNAKSLANSELHLRTIIDNQPDCVKLLDREGRVLQMNPSGLRIIEADSFAAVQGQCLYHLLSPEDVPVFLASNEQVFAGIPCDNEFKVQTLKGNTRWLYSKTVPLKDTDHQVIAALSVTRDVTAEKAARSALEFSQTLMNVTLDSTDEGMLLLTGQILFANKRFYQLWQLPEAADNAQDVQKLFSSVLTQLVDPEQFTRELQQSDAPTQDTLFFKDGRVFWRFSRALEINAQQGRIWCFRDITSSHKTQLALAEREEIYRTIVTQAADGIVLIDAEHKTFVEFNAAACEALGYSRDEFAQLSLYAIQAAGETEHFTQCLAQVQANGHAEFDSLHRHKDGTQRNVHLSLRFIHLQGKAYFAGIITDITHRIAVEKQLSQKERYQRALLDNFPFLVWLKDQDSRYLTVNQALANASNAKDTHSLIGKTDFDLWPAELAAKYRADDLEVMHTLTQKNVEEQIVIHGNLEWIETYKAPILDANNALLGTVGFARIITDRKQIQQELRLSRERLYFALQGANDGLWDWNLETDQVYYSPRWKSMLGYEEHELDGNLETWIKLCDPEMRDKVLAHASAYLAGLVPVYDIEFRMRHKQGHWVDVLSRAKIAEDEQGNIVYPKRLIGTHVDITERKRVASALSASTALLNSVINTAPIRVFWKDKNLRYLGCNTVFAQDANLAVSELIGKDDFQLHWANEAPLYQADDLQVMQTGVPKLSYDEPQTTPDGSQLWIRTSKVPLRDESDAIIGILGIYEDITSYKHAEQALQESEERFRKLFEDTAEAILLMENDRFIDANLAALHLLGFIERQDLLGKSILDLSSEFQAYDLFSVYNFNEYIQGALEIGAQQFEWTLVQQNGDLLTVEVLLTPIYYQQRHILHMVLRDITERKSMEIALRRSEEGFNRAQAVGKVGSWILDFKTGALECSAEMYRICGIAPADKVDLHYFVQIVHPEDREMLYQAWKKVLKGLTFLDVEHRAIISGELCWVRERAEIEFSTEGLPSKCIGMIRDITQQKLTEAELDKYHHHLEDLVRQRTAELEDAMQAAEAASRAKSTFLANMSHEIRTPMNAVIGLTHLLRKETENPKHRAQLVKINEAAQHLLSIINDVLDLSKIEAGKMTIENIQFSPEQVIDHVVSMLNERAMHKELRLYTEIDPAVPDILIGDPLRIQQVLLNFVNNAIKFSNQGDIVIRLRRLSEQLSDNGITVRFEVEDQGIGLSPEQQGRLFKVFSQADESTTRKYGGTGLGLAIVQRIADMMGGATGVESTLGVGSCFWLAVTLLPGQSQPEERGLHTESISSKQLEILLKQQYAGARILVAEDDPISQEVAEDLLSYFGLNVDVVANGQLAVEKLLTNDYALVFMDMQMPVMDGVVATRAIRALPGKMQLPIIAMTANAFEENREECLQAGMNDHVGKPVDPEKLLQILMRWLPNTLKVEQLEQPDRRTVFDPAQKAILLGIAGLDVEMGLKVVRGDQQKFIKVLNLFVQNHVHDIATLQSYINDGRFSDARRLAHTLKGVAASIGAQELYLSALELERVFKEQLDKPVQLGALSQCAQQLEPLLSATASALASIATLVLSAEKSAVDQAAVERLFGQIDALLAQDDTRVNQVWNENITLISQVLGMQAIKLQAALDEFKYDQVLLQLRESLQALGLTPRV